MTKRRFTVLLFVVMAFFAGKAVAHVKPYREPTADVRSVSEVFLHVSAANYNLPKLIGAPAPASINVKSLEKSATDKAKVAGTLKDSFAHLKQAILKMPGRRSGKEP